MKGLLGLIQNELAKEYRQVSRKIMIIIVLAAAIGYPLARYVNMLMNSNWLINEEQYYERHLEESDSEIEKEFCRTSLKAKEFYNKNGIDEENWRMKYFYDYEAALVGRKALDMIVNDGKRARDVLKYFYISGVKETVRMSGDEPIYTGEYKYTYDNEKYSAVSTLVNYGETVDFTIDLAALLLEAFENYTKELEGKITEDFSKYLVSCAYEGQSAYNEAKKAFETEKLRYESNRETLSDYQQAQLTLKGSEIYLSTISELQKTDIKDESMTAWALSAMERLISQSYNFTTITEKEFDERGGRPFNSSNARFTGYEEYKLMARERQTVYIHAFEIMKYGILNQIPVPDEYNFSERLYLRDAITVNVRVIMFICIFLAAGIAATEYSSGAIRLLLIRPRARWKILLSKLCCILILMLSAVIVSSAVSVIVHGVIYGWSELSQPFVVYGNRAEEVPSLLYFAYYMLIQSLPSMMCVCFAFMLSVVIKKAAIAMVPPMLTDIFGGYLSQHMYYKLYVEEWRKFTPLPFFELHRCILEPVLYVYEYDPVFNYGLTVWNGVVVMAVYGLFFLGIAFAVFCRNEIKS